MIGNADYLFGQASMLLQKAVDLLETPEDADAQTARVYIAAKGSAVVALHQVSRARMLALEACKQRSLSYAAATQEVAAQRGDTGE